MSNRGNFLRLIAEALAPSFIMLPVLARREKLQAAAWKAEDRRLKLSLRARSWREAQELAGRYDNALLNDFRIQRSKLYRPSKELFRKNILSPVSAMLSRPDLAITDFGGATGELGLEFKNVYPLASYTIVEHASLVNMIAELKPGPVHFSTETPAQCDIFYASGVVQYVEHPEAALVSGFASARHAVILRRTFLSNEKIFEVQKSRLYDNGTGPIPLGFEDREISYPRQTLCEETLLDLARSCGFECVYDAYEPATEDEHAYGKEFVFRRT